MFSSSLPPLGNLPHWSRVGNLEKVYSPRPMARNPLQAPLSSPGSGCRRAPQTHGDMTTRVASLERDIQFLQDQHKDTLAMLHAEIDNLKRENKELQYNLIMDRPGAPRKCTGSSSGSSEGSKLQTENLPRKRVHLERPAPIHREVVCRQDTEKGGYTPAGREVTDGPQSELVGGLITSLQPLRIHSNPSLPPRPPTLHECEVIIRQLYNANSLQSQEILRVKAILKDIVSSQKINPELYIMTKSFLPDSTSRGVIAEEFPKLPLKVRPKKQPGSQPCVAEKLVLPALRPSLGNSAAERQKRTQALHRRSAVSLPCTLRNRTQLHSYTARCHGDRPDKN